MASPGLAGSRAPGGVADRRDVPRRALGAERTVHVGYIFALLAADIAAFHPERKNLFLLLVGLSFAYLLGNNDLGMRFISPIDPGIWPYAEQLDASAGYGMVRYYALLAISVLIAVTLAQLVYVILRDDPRPRPWLLPFLRGRPRPAPPNPEPGPP